MCMTLRTCHLLSPEVPQPPVIGKVSHHSIELSWMNEENKPRTGPPEHWSHFSVEQMDPKTHKYSTKYMSVFSRSPWTLFLCTFFILKLAFQQHSNPLVFYLRGYGTHHVLEGLESSTSYSFRLKVTRPSGECSFSPAVSVFTTREIFYLQSKT